mgnify:CR=1 FL=1
MRFAFVYDQDGNTPPPGEPIPHTQGRHPQPPPPPAVRIALAAEESQARAHLGSDRARACLDRLLHTISTQKADSTPALDPDEFDQDQLFRPWAFRTRPQEGRA